jgi:hypothetical protein
MTQPCRCDEAAVHRRIKGAPAEQGIRFHFDPDPALSAVAKAAHHCGYIKRRNGFLKQAEQLADALARAELPGEPSGSPKWNMIQVKHFHAEMARLMGTPNYVPKLALVVS